MKHLHLFLVLCLALVGCASSADKPFEGFFIYGHEVSDFKPCNGSDNYWLNGESSSMELIENASMQLSKKTGKPYQAIYVQFSGYIDERPPTGFEQGTDGLLYMTELLTYSENAPETCQ
ncbi:hypothetical protein [Shewanella maritima]|uniref:hypothetical protein n=1 Tax=Shewanella maritima TaxID=2520507 RepID=UPI0037363B47